MMSDSAAAVIERILQILADGFSPGIAGAVVVALCLLAAFVYLRRPGAVQGVGMPASGPTITVTVGNNTTRISSATIGNGQMGPPAAERPSARRCYARLQRIAALPAEDDEEFTIT